MKLSNQIALSKAQQYCAYQDRSHAEVRKKLISLKIFGDDLEELLSELIQDGYLDELRYAKSYARGKFNMKKWGRNKIKQGLQKQHVSDYCIRKAMDEIDEEDYLKALNDIFQKKYKAYKDESEFISISKARNYCLGRGYEMSLVLKCEPKKEG